MRLAIQQRALPHFRAPLYDALAERHDGPVEVFTGHAESDEGIVEARQLDVAIWRKTENYCFSLGGHRFYWQQGLNDWIKQFQPDVLVAESNPRLLSNYIGLRLARNLGIPVFGWGIGVMGNPTNKGVYRLFMRQYFRQFNSMIVYSRKGASDLIQLGVNSERIFIAPNSVSHVEAVRLQSEKDNGKQRVRDWKDHLGLGSLPVLIFVGRLIPEKKVDILIRAVSQLKTPCELLVVGDGPMREELEGLSSTLPKKTYFLGHLEGRNLALSIAASDLFVMPGTGGLAVQEAMAFGTPVIVGSSDGTQWDLVEDGVTGYHLRTGTLEELHDILVKCLENTDALVEMGKAARERIEKSHNIDIVVNEVLAAIHRL